MEKKIGLEANELERIFAEIKQNKKSDMDEKVYKAYLPLVEKFSHKFHIKMEKVQDIYNDVFVCVYQNIMEGAIKPSEFTMCFENLFAKTCLKAGQTKPTQSESLSNRLIAREANRRAVQEQKSNEYARQSIMYVAQILAELSQDEEAMAGYGLTKMHIDVIRDYHGLNVEEKSYSLAELAEKYNVTEARAKAVLVKALSVLRKSHEFDVVKEGRFAR